MRLLHRIAIVSLVTLLSMVFLLPAEARAMEAEVTININGTTLIFNGGEQGPEIIGARTYVPLRVISESLGAKVDWVPESRQVIITTNPEDPDLIIVNQNDDIQIVIDGKVLAVAPDLGQPYISPLSRTMIPLRAVGEALNCAVDWVDESRTVIITQPVQQPIEVPSLPEVVSENDKLLQDLAQYQSNLKLLDGSVINSRELLNMNAASYNCEQLAVFKKYNDLLKPYLPNVSLPNGENVLASEITIKGPALLTADQLNQWMERETPRIMANMESKGRTFNPIPNLAQLYIEIGEAYGIRGDLAYCQAVKETGYFQFTGQVQPWQNNYCGLWATGNPIKGDESFNGADPAFVRFEPGYHGAVFASPAAGVEAHIQHLYAYATNEPLPAGKTLIDPRYSLVRRGIASTWCGLNARWAVPGTTYGQSIIADYWLKAFN